MLFLYWQTAFNIEVTDFTYILCYIGWIKAQESNWKMVEQHCQLDQICASTPCMASFKKSAVFSQTRMETQPNSAQCIHFIKTDALHISVLIGYTPCCKPYGAEYAVMNNKPQYEPESVIFQPCQSLKSLTLKLTSEFQTWMTDCSASPWTVKTASPSS